MGIRGLTTFISHNSQHFHEPFRLHDSLLIIDGNSLASKLYVEVSKCESTYGGDYDKYSSSVSKFFSALSKCNITPLVVLDGGYEPRKLKTVESRLKAKLHAAHMYKNLSQPGVSVFPLLMKEVFKQCLRDIGVKFVQADFEADYEVAAIARQLNCPVLSQDSDFYVFDVKYIPFSTLSLHVLKGKNQKHYLKCEVFKTEKFVQYFGGLDKSLLPLLGTLLGNDYVPISVFENFFNHVKLPGNKKMSIQQRRICAIFEWLRGETFDSAVSKVMVHFKKNIRKQIWSEINRSLAGYRQCTSSLLEEFHLNLEETSGGSVEARRHEEKPEPSYLLTSEKLNVDLSSGESCEEDIALDSKADYWTPSGKAVQKDKASLPIWPKWVQDKFRRGDLPSFMSDIFYLRMFFCQPQVEDFSLEDSHIVSFPILKIANSLLVSNSLQTSDKLIKNFKPSLACFSRSGTRVHKVQLDPISDNFDLSLFPSLTLLPSVSIDFRRKFYLIALGFESKKDTEILINFPDSLILFATIVCYWARNSVTPKVNIYHLHAIVLTWIILGLVDIKLNKCGDETSLCNNCNINAHKEDTTLCKDVCAQGSSENLNDEGIPEASTLQSKLDQVTCSDCKLLVEKLTQFRVVQPKHLKSNKHTSMWALHSFAQLQSCMQQAMALNSLLCDAFPDFKVCSTYSGTLAFSAFMTLKGICDLDTYIESLLKESPTVHNFYNTLILTLKLLLPDSFIPLRKAEKRPKRSIQKQSTSSSEDVIDSDESSDSDYCLDKNNKFSILSME